MRTLDIRLVGLAYTAKLARPVFELWGRGAQIVGSLYDALSPYGVTPSQIRLNGNLPHVGDPLITVRIFNENSTVKFAFDRMEFVFNHFTTESFQHVSADIASKHRPGWQKRILNLSSPRTLSRISLTPSFRMPRRLDVLKQINPQKLVSAGDTLGNGITFHNLVPDKGWRTNLTLDLSLQLPGALFIGLSIELDTDKIDYEVFMNEARSYYRTMLAELELQVPVQ